jgi:actin-related protein 5
MYRETCYFSSDYEDEIRSLADPAKMSEMTKVIQFPFTQAVSSFNTCGLEGADGVQEIAEKSEAELAAATERRREQGKRLQEMQARQRAEKVSECAGATSRSC